MRLYESIFSCVSGLLLFCALRCTVDSRTNSLAKNLFSLTCKMNWALAYFITWMPLIVSCYHLGTTSYLDRLSLSSQSRQTSSATPCAQTFQLDPKETALVLIEYQNEFLSEGGKLYEPLKECLDHTNMIENSAKLTKIAREKGCAILHVPIMFGEVSRHL